MTTGPPRPPSDPSVAPATASIVPPAPETVARPANDAPTVKPAPPVPPGSPRSGFRPRAEQLPLEFGRYRVTKLLGEGGMGAVYLAHDSQLDRLVALKVPQFEAGDGPLMRERFLREARAAATLHHANICPVYDVGEIDGASYMTMAFIEGRSLAEVLREQIRVAPRAVALLLRKVALALDEAHRKQVVHRDLKPGNIMLNERNEPVVMDFGLARRGGADARITRAGDIMGTPAYMAPEQASGIQEKIGPQCDVYSLGVILYEMLCGRVPFAGDTMAVLTQVLLDEPPPPSAHRPDVDPQLEAICKKAMAKKPENRYHSMAQLAAAFTEYLKADAAPPKPDNTAVTVGSPPASQLPPRGRRRWLVAGGVVAAALAVAIAIYLWTDTGTVRVRLSDPNAAVEVTIDGEPVPRTRTEPAVRLRAGEHLLEVAGKDFKTIGKVFSVKRGDDFVLEVALEPAATAGPAEKPRRAQSALARAREHLQKRETESAVAAASQALDDDPTLVDAHLVRAEALASGGKWGDVIRDCTAALKLRPRSVEAHVLRARAKINLQLYDAAIADCTDALRLDDRCAAAYLNRGSAHSVKGDDARAVADFTDAIRLDPDCSRAYLERGLIYALQKDDAKARADFAKAAKLAPDLKAKIPPRFADAPR